MDTSKIDFYEGAKWISWLGRKILYWNSFSLYFPGKKVFGAKQNLLTFSFYTRSEWEWERTSIMKLICIKLPSSFYHTSFPLKTNKLPFFHASLRLLSWFFFVAMKNKKKNCTSDDMINNDAVHLISYVDTYYSKTRFQSCACVYFYLPCFSCTKNYPILIQHVKP